MLFIWLRKKAYEKCFYGIIMFICSIILFAFPLAELTYDNDAYLSASTLREMKEMKNIELYSTDPKLAPEMIFDLGEPFKRVKSADELPQNNKFGFMVWDSIPAEVQNNFDMEFITKFDINNRKKGKSGHKARKTSDLYLLEKKQ